jgi:hypothetical protein
MQRNIFVLSLILSFLSIPLASAQSPFGYSLATHDLIPSMKNGIVLLGDYDRDGDFDAFVSGLSDLKSEGTVYRYQGIERRTDPVGNVTLVHLFKDAFAVLPSVSFSAGTLGDFNNDGQLDMAMMGMSTDKVVNVPQSMIYLNRGGTSAMVNANVGLPALYSGEIAATDFDNDGDQDILVAGVAADGTYQTKLYRNNGIVAGSNPVTLRPFTEVTTAIDGLAFGDADFGDYDRDGDQDLLISGSTGSTMVSKIYRNDSGVFTDINAPLLGMTHCSVDWGDYDNDGDLDVLMSGGRFASEIMKGVAKVYKNEGSNKFTDTNTALVGTFAGSAQWGDYDNDGDLDIMIAGLEDVLGVSRTCIYQNQAGVFVHVINLAGMYLGTPSFADFDNDLDLDILIPGTTGSSAYSNLYLNTALTLNLQPDVPPNPTATVTGSIVKFAWGAASDLVTASAGLSYNIRVGTSAGGTQIVSPLANLTTGRRMVYDSGNVGAGLSWTLNGLPKGTYYWSVQTLDASYSGSRFTTEGTFTISASPNTNPSVANEDDTLPSTQLVLKNNFPNPFSQSTTLTYSLPKTEQVKVAIYDILGKEVRILANGQQNGGFNTLSWDGCDLNGQRLSAGMYVAKVQAGDQIAVQKMMLVR